MRLPDHPDIAHGIGVGDVDQAHPSRQQRNFLDRQDGNAQPRTPQRGNGRQLLALDGDLRDETRCGAKIFEDRPHAEPADMLRNASSANVSSRTVSRLASGLVVGTASRSRCRSSRRQTKPGMVGRGDTMPTSTCPSWTPVAIEPAAPWVTSNRTPGSRSRCCRMSSGTSQVPNECRNPSRIGVKDVAACSTTAASPAAISASARRRCPALADDRQVAGGVHGDPTSHWQLDSTGYPRGSAGYRSLTLALFAAGMSTFAAMYSAQAASPELAAGYRIPVAGATLAVSATTGMVALAIIPASVLSERFGHIRVMTGCAVTSAILGVLIPLAPSFGLLVIGRALQGLAQAGVPAVAMAYLAEEVQHAAIGAAMGRYVVGTTIGGLAGRLVTSLALDVMSWRWAMGLRCRTGAGVHGDVHPAGAAVPPVRAETDRSADGGPQRPRAAAQSGTGVSVPAGVPVDGRLRLDLQPARIPAAGSAVRTAADNRRPGLLLLSGRHHHLGDRWPAGRQARAPGGAADRCDRYRRRPAADAAGVVDLGTAGMLLFTGGFFAAHAVASGWIGRVATEHRAEASSVYLFCYYLGSAVAGSVAGVAFSRAQWGGAVGYVGILLAIAGLTSIALAVLSRRTLAGRTGAGR